MSVRHGVSTHAGNRRQENQDAYVTRRPVYLVADGMGGHALGREAARLVVSAFDTAITGEWVTPADLQVATRAAAAAVESLTGSGPGRPGSTVTGVALARHDGRPAWLVFNIGDSRTYRVRGGLLEQVTVDHSRLQELVETGVSDSEARQRVSSNVITRAIGGGMRQSPELDQWVLPAAVGDRLLLCSDGVTGELSDALIAATLLSHEDPQEAAQALVDGAVSAGGRDNVTAIVLDAMRVEGSVATDGLDGWEVDTLTDGEVIEAEATVPDAPGPDAGELS
jgi:PPM family protein phosphatase